MADYIPVNYTKIITIEPGKRFGKPCIRDLSMTVGDVLEYLASGMSENERPDDFPDLTPDDFPDLTKKDFRACLAFAAARGRRFSLAPINSVVWNDEAGEVVMESQAGDTE